ncbi:NAD(P)-dependent dehydrogenase (short-subunit alcohol dehydrogenase family) [Amycolatopsis bartoniae]|uniref:Short-chain dehydrogenase n=1 Tax=Amycolatopsis bartoniae TaxID=941986 RepID=A0A8H9M977_9PSEU|nr:SDR family oxidoreductase [Amycolatopsis bartoniae]MBB2939570.1 NAD(P)-dependent dehydrogenase (short-subunit alcohol dehydrogenase family) [Amycolatopsis bartoniae]TVT07782.1 SDR family oxidoreductase [Amycolatopsis bartoniae]GHF39283.1 short-chain dehydrogenase [Amycolatopsis bartoniae]
MEIKGSVALVTGANRGLGRHFAATLLERGAAKVYAAARRPESVDLPGVVPLALDITDPASVRAAAEQAGDVTLLINNAGVSTGASALHGNLGDVRLEMETHYFGTLAMARAFAPVLARGGGGAVLNVLSVLSWLTVPRAAAYSAAKAAALQLTNALRLELRDQGTQVTALHVGYMETDMAAHVDGPKVDPATVAAQALDGVERGLFEVIADDASRHVRSKLSGDLAGLYPQLA